jgi:Rad3-related DNA helicase
MNKVQQAAGRLIRTETDRGIIALLDSRFSWGSNRRMFPREWSDVRTVTINNVSDVVESFWNKWYDEG